MYSMLWLSAIFFGIIGALRGWNREIVATAGIVLATFVLFQFDSLLRNALLLTIASDQAFIIQIVIFAIIIYFAYQSRTVVEDRTPDNRSRAQYYALGALVGAFNGYLMWSAVWYLLDINQYPLYPLVIAPAPGSVTEQYLNAIPLVALGGLAGGSDLLIIVVIIMFLIVIFMI
jgi:hypothetical protein